MEFLIKYHGYFGPGEKFPESKNIPRVHHLTDLADFDWRLQGYPPGN